MQVHKDENKTKKQKKSGLAISSLRNVGHHDCPTKKIL